VKVLGPKPAHGDDSKRNGAIDGVETSVSAFSSLLWLIRCAALLWALSCRLLYINLLTGVIPSEVGRLTALTSLYAYQH
jgi:hypothetical protein